MCMSNHPKDGGMRSSRFSELLQPIFELLWDRCGRWLCRSPQHQAQLFPLQLITPLSIPR